MLSIFPTTWILRVLELEWQLCIYLRNQVDMLQLIFHEPLNVTKIRAYIRMSVTYSHNSRLCATHAIDISNNLSTPPTGARVAVMYLFEKSGRYIAVNFPWTSERDQNSCIYPNVCSCIYPNVCNLVPQFQALCHTCYRYFQQFKYSTYWSLSGSYVFIWEIRSKCCS